MNEKLKSLMQEKGITMYALAKHVGVSVTSMNYKVNQKNLSAQFEELKAIAEVLDCEIEDFID